MSNAKKRYAEKVQVVKTIWLHKEKDKDIIAWLEKQPSLSGYIKELVRDAIKKN